MTLSFLLRFDEMVMLLIKEVLQILVELGQDYSKIIYNIDIV